MKTKLGKLKGRIFSKNHDRGAPPGQFVTEKFPVLTFGETPKIDIAQWNLKLFGLTQNDIILKWDNIMGLKRVSIEAEFHCVTQWSRLVNTWDGVSFKSIIDFVDVPKDTRYAMIHCYGGPLRLVVPKRYGWKSAKWVNGVEFMTENRAGFWESRGYHMDGDPWKEQRFN